MGLIELFLIAVGLSMDAFAVSVCKGLAMPKCTFKKAAIVGLWFGGFQALMPAIGYILGAQFQEAIASIDHWIAFVLLALIGGNMIHEALDNDEEEADASLDVKPMFLLAVATSIDALAIGITFAFLKVNIIPAVCFIGIVTFIISCFSDFLCPSIYYLCNFLVFSVKVAFSNNLFSDLIYSTACIHNFSNFCI